MADSGQNLDTRIIEWADTRTKPTKALPKHSLFGTGLELLSVDDRELAERLFLQKQAEKLGKHKYSDNAFLNRHYEELEAQNAQAKLALQQLKQREIEAKYTAVKRLAIEKNLRQQRNKLNNGTVIAPYATLESIDNGVAVSTSRSNNSNSATTAVTAPYATFELKTQTHDGHTSSSSRPLKGYLKHRSIPLPTPDGADIVARQRAQNATSNTVNKQRRAVGLHYVPKEYFIEEMKNRKVDLPPLAIEIPRNILHQFHTNVCVELLSDPNKVTNSQRALEQANNRRVLPAIESRNHDNHEAINARPSDGYRDLGQLVRVNVFPGTAEPVTMATSHAHYSSDVWTQRYPIVDTYRNRVDDFAKWSESNVHRDRILKAWDDYEMEKRGNKKHELMQQHTQ